MQYRQWHTMKREQIPSFCFFTCFDKSLGDVCLLFSPRITKIKQKILQYSSGKDNLKKQRHLIQKKKLLFWANKHYCETIFSSGLLLYCTYCTYCIQTIATIVMTKQFIHEVVSSHSCTRQFTLHISNMLTELVTFLSVCETGWMFKSDIVQTAFLTDSE